MTKNEQSLRDIWNSIKHINVCTMGNQKRRGRTDRRKRSQPSALWACTSQGSMEKPVLAQNVVPTRTSASLGAAPSRTALLRHLHRRQDQELGHDWGGTGVLRQRLCLSCSLPLGASHGLLFIMHLTSSVDFEIMVFFMYIVYLCCCLRLWDKCISYYSILTRSQHGFFFNTEKVND